VTCRTRILESKHGEAKGQEADTRRIPRATPRLSFESWGGRNAVPFREQPLGRDLVLGGIPNAAPLSGPGLGLGLGDALLL
jgi:hypothetical protein